MTVDWNQTPANVRRHGVDMAAGSRTRNKSVRAEKARATRARIVRAATELFVRNGYVQTTMADIAGAAGVAVQTLYLSFGSKVAVLSAALDVAIAGDDEPMPVLDRPWFAEPRDEPDGPAALRIFLRMAGGIIERVYPLYTVTARAAADPEPAEVLERNKRLRLETQGHVVRELSGKRGFTTTADAALDLVCTLVSQETYGLMVAERGRSRDDWIAFVDRRLRAELFGVATGSSGRRRS